ncbi:phosphatase PAP2 family protein [Natronobacterium gregoryi]|uniref:Membrane-associated phospholipid phosphatase n=2 Tax=Natronobacterium gregoryi TaxID=44930 RepID=L0AJT2_NATGS|nr:phosphatase PAP2 family protein [Natronobacterium gregoryi]AFZ74133.1 membrane-associated phospholipid phosphatase [Natronobacterium gregoryi SP2]ELY63870.1 phosphatidylglycerophosphatase [Natronobacterium gregoryi SP2]PLK22072.1 phosphatase PAP2 family protein [Natronobacterium gregoryi SP2]SFI50064.1 Membrane-associated phospholipid phosphatase [Natronobacterium gregoryi]
MSEEQVFPTRLFDPELNRAIHEALPGVVVDAFGALTVLGDGAILVAIATLLYWFGSETDRHDRAMVLAVAVTTLALVTGLKGILEIPRPLYVAEPPLEFAPAAYPGWSTPSAHAMGAAAVYGALAVVTNTGTRHQRYAAAAFLVVTIPLSRVVIGVHYLGDVIIGATLGLLLVAVAVRITTRSVTPMFALSLAIAVAAFALGSEEFTTMAIGASLGGLVTWPLLENRTANPLAASLLFLGLLVLPLLGVVKLLEVSLAVEGGLVIAGTMVSLASILETIGFALAFGGALAVPYLATRLNDTDAVRKLQTVLPFRGRHVELAAVGDEPSVDDRTRF